MTEGVVLVVARGAEGGDNHRRESGSGAGERKEEKKIKMMVMAWRWLDGIRVKKLTG